MILPLAFLGAYLCFASSGDFAAVSAVWASLELSCCRYVTPIVALIVLLTTGPSRRVETERRTQSD